MARTIVRAVLSMLLAVLVLAPSATPGVAESVRWDKIAPDLRAQMECDPQAGLPVIVEAAPASQLGQDNRSARAAERSRAHGASPGASLDIIGATAASANYDAIAALSRDAEVAYVYYDAPMHALEAVPPAHVYDEVVGAPPVWDLGYTGQGVGVAVLDSGIAPVADLTQPDNRIVARVDLVGDGADQADPGGHGTHVAGIIAGNGHDSLGEPSGPFTGVAPKANLLDVRVIDATGGTHLSTVIEGVQWTILHRREYNVRVMNLSLGAAVSAHYSY
ncbi:MAG: S8 family serine peptidase, partial [Dehalococcoidales bacterium]|nr:S8 family serine peptidase [Dehalococcoidales bacterium]